MALLTLKDIGKIYVSEGNVTVGIRGVDLSFDRGEFVAITGKSGSGKSTLLNVISGMDSYEEGELYIEGQPTSHYMQPDWEEYRSKYISFIFQDYNIIESFTVLQNVELALMHIEDKKERRRRALDLIEKVGLSSHVKHKGSKLSGGQKQRTVIARALAKDSPIILADEPTGNLDSATSAEIIELLREISKEKLLIVVTHNFEQVAECATRHIRVFDGAVESDQKLRSSHVLETCETPNAKEMKRGEKTAKNIKKGLTLGSAIFTSKPKLSVFLCFLMIVGTLGIFLVTALCGEAGELFEPTYMFEHIDGRVVVTKRSGEPISEDEIKKIAEEYGAESYLRFDSLLDINYNNLVIPLGDGYRNEYVRANYTYGEDFGDDIIGRYPEKNNEIFLYLPISYKKTIGSDSIVIDEAVMGNMTLKITGVKYYYDNNITPRCLFTEEGFRTATAVQYLYGMSSNNITVMIGDGKTGMMQSLRLENFVPSFDIPADKVYANNKAVEKVLASGGDTDISITFNSVYYNYDYRYDTDPKSMNFSKTFEKGDLATQAPQINTHNLYNISGALIISDELIRDIAEDVLDASYRQSSLFFESDREARMVASMLSEGEYIAVSSDTEYEPAPEEAILSMLVGVMMAFVMILAILFIAFFINLCSSRTLGAFKGDMAIMRSMGIPAKVIKIGMYVRMLIALIPAFLLVICVGVLIFTSPSFNEFFTYLYPWQYALIFVGMIALTARVTYKQIRKLFHESVKKSLKGGAAE